MHVSEFQLGIGIVIKFGIVPSLAATVQKDVDASKSTDILLCGPNVFAKDDFAAAFKTEIVNVKSTNKDAASQENIANAYDKKNCNQTSAALN